MNKNRFSSLIIVFLFAAVFGLAGPAWAGQAKAAAQQVPDEFFIITEVNLQKHQLILKMPTEVTVPMTATDKTVIVDENGKHLALKDLRAGDTAFITYTKNAQGDTAVKIRLGIMTVEELHRRYLNGYAIPIPAPPSPTQPRPSRSEQRGAADR